VSATVIKAPDTQPPIKFTLTSADPDVDLTDVTSALVILTPHGGATVTKTGTIASATADALVVTWRNDGTLAPGTYRAWVKVTWNGNPLDTQHAPTDGALTLSVQPIA
jgi:hypothetical protein